MVGIRIVSFLLEEVSVDFGETCRALQADGTFADRFLIWLPYDDYGGIDPINPATDALFKEGLVCDADTVPSPRQFGAAGKEQGDQPKGLSCFAAFSRGVRPEVWARRDGFEGV